MADLFARHRAVITQWVALRYDVPEVREAGLMLAVDMIDPATATAEEASR